MTAQRKKRLSRTEKNDILLAQAASVEVPAVADVVVMGGGASGLVAAITAAEILQEEGHPGTVIIFEKALECGRSILATGGGRCNFANENLRPEYYRHPAFIRSVAGGKYLKDILSFFPRVRTVLDHRRRRAHVSRYARSRLCKKRTSRPSRQSRRYLRLCTKNH